MCLLNFNCQWNSVRLPIVCGPHLLGMAGSRETVWEGGGVGTFRLVVCCDCLCLVDLFRGILPYDLRRSCLPNLFLKDICCWRTIERELDSSGRFIPPCHAPLSSCLAVSQIKNLWTDAIVGWDINALLLLCVGVHGATVGVVAPVGVTIQVTWLSSLVGGFSRRSVWLPLVSRWAWLWCRQIGARGLTVVCSGGFGIVYRSLLFAASVCRLAVYCAAGFRWCVLIVCSDCLRFAACRAFRFLQ